MGCIHEIKQAGLRVPDDVSVIGFDDTRYAAITDPPLTTIAQPAELIGQRTMVRILDAVDGIDIGSEPEIVPHKLVLRASTGAPAS